MKQVALPQSSDDMCDIMMQVQDEPVLLQDSAQENAVVVLSQEDYDIARRTFVDDLLDLCHEMRSEAEANGLTDEILAEILSEQ